MHHAEVVRKHVVMLERVVARVVKRGFPLKVHHAANRILVEGAPFGLKVRDRLQRILRGQALLQTSLRREEENSHAEYDCDEQCVHSGNGFLVGRPGKAACHIHGKHGNHQKTRKKRESHMIEGFKECEEENCQLVNLPLSSAQAIGNHKKSNRQPGCIAGNGVQAQGLPLLRNRHHLLLVQQHVKRVPDEPPAIGIDQKHQHGNHQDEGEAAAFNACPCMLLDCAHVE